MELTDYLRIARTYWLGICLIVLGVTALAGIYTLLQPRVYAADSSGIIRAEGTGDIGGELMANNLAKSQVQDYLVIAQSRGVAERVITDLDLDTSPDALTSQVSITNPTDTSILRVSARATSPADAQTLADAWMQSTADEVIARASTSNDANGSLLGIDVYTSASLPGSPVSPNVRLDLAVGLLAGLGLAAVYALLRHRLDRRLNSVEAVESRFDVTVLGTLPLDSRLQGDNRIAPEVAINDSDRSHHAMAESLRALRTNLQFMDVDNPPRIFAVTSPLPGDGKSSVAANLAITLAVSGQKVVLVDGDLRRPTVAKTFKVLPGVGLTDVLVGSVEVDDVLQERADIPNLAILGTGVIPPNPSELLGSRAMEHVLEHLARDAIVLIDAPPLLPVTDAAILAAKTDGALIVISAGTTTEDLLERALANVEKVKGRTLGVIINRVQKRGAFGNYYYYYDQYAYTAKPERFEEAKPPVTPVNGTAASRRSMKSESSRPSWAPVKR